MAFTEDWSKAVTQTVDAAGILSSRSCRYSEKSKHAFSVLSYLLHRTAQSKHLGCPAGRHYHREWMIPTVRRTRASIPLSPGLGNRQGSGVRYHGKWAISNDIKTASSSATRSDRLADGAMK